MRPALSRSLPHKASPPSTGGMGTVGHVQVRGSAAIRVAPLLVGDRSPVGGERTSGDLPGSVRANQQRRDADNNNVPDAICPCLHTLCTGDCSQCRACQNSGPVRLTLHNPQTHRVPGVDRACRGAVLPRDRTKGGR